MRRKDSRIIHTCQRALSNQTPDKTPGIKGTNMNQPSFIQEASERISETLNRILPDTSPDFLNEKIAPVLENVMASLQLVPKAEFEAHIKLLTQLEDRVSDLEQRLREME